MARKRVILWDCDDSLVDSERLAMGVAIDVLADAVLALNAAAVIDRMALVREFGGWHFHKMIPEMETRHGVKLDIVALDGLKIPATLKALEAVTACPGVPECLARLSANGHDQAVVTSSEFDRVNLCLAATGISHYFPEDRKFSANDTLKPAQHKPSPAIYLHALQALDVTAEEAVAVEDSSSGVRSAVAAGVPVIGFVGASNIPADGKQARAELLLSLGAKIIVSHMDDFEAALAYMEGDHTVTFKHPVFKPAAQAAATQAVNSTPRALPA